MKLQCNLLFVLHRLLNDFVVKVDIVSFDPSVEPSENLASPIMMLAIGTPPRRLWENDIDHKHDTQHCPLCVDEVEVVVGLAIGKDFKSGRSEQLTYRVPTT